MINMGYNRLWGLLVLAGDICAIINIFQSSVSNEKKLIRTIAVVLLPAPGLILWYFLDHGTVVRRRVGNLRLVATRIKPRDVSGRSATQLYGTNLHPQPGRFSRLQVASLRKDFQAGKLSKSELPEKYGISRATVYRVAAVAS